MKISKSSKQDIKNILNASLNRHLGSIRQDVEITQQLLEEYKQLIESNKEDLYKTTTWGLEDNLNKIQGMITSLQVHVVSGHWKLAEVIDELNTSSVDISEIYEES